MIKIHQKLLTAQVGLGTDHDDHYEDPHHTESYSDDQNCFDYLIDHDDHNEHVDNDDRDDQDASEAGHSSTNGHGPDHHPHHLDFDQYDHCYEPVVLQSPSDHHHHNEDTSHGGNLDGYDCHDNHDGDHDQQSSSIMILMLTRLVKNEEGENFCEKNFCFG